MSEPAWEVERALLGGLMLDPTQIRDVQDLVSAPSFHRPQHGKLFELLCRIQANGAADVVAVMDEIGRRDAFEDYGGAAYIAAMPNACPSVEHLPAYAERVRDHATRRDLTMALTAGLELVRTGELDTPDLCDWVETGVFAVTRAGAPRAFHTMPPLVDEQLRYLELLSNIEGTLTGLPSRFVDLDRLTAGWQPTDLIIVAARPAMGKTAFAMQLATEGARAGFAVGVFSLEMSRQQLVRRMLSSEGRLDASQMRIGRLEVADWRRLTEAAEIVADLPIVVDDTPGLTIGQLRTKARAMKAQHPRLGLIIIDYLQLMQGTGGVRESRVEAVSVISRGLKILAKELGVPVIALSQLSRAVEQRTDKRPVPSDLRESGSIEQDADLILFLYRDEYYNPDSLDKGLAEVIIAKQRNGPTGTVKLAWLGQYTRFSNYAAQGDHDGYV